VPYPTQDWPVVADTAPEHVAVNAILDRAFAGARPESLARTKAIVVVSAGRIVAEHYADGITPDTRLQSWSTAKSFLHAALGAAIGEAKLDPQKPAPVPEWQGAGDARKPITIDNLFRQGTQPFPVIYPMAADQVAKQFGGDAESIPAAVGLDPSTYQNFAITNDSLIFFFDRGAVLSEAAGAFEVTVPRGPIDSMIA